MQLAVTYTRTDPDNNLQGYKLGLSAVGADMPSEVFVCQRRVPSATDPQYSELPDKFVSLADPVDLEHYPVGAPALETGVPFYRVAAIELVFRTVSELEEVQVMLDDDIRELIHSLTVMGTDTAEETVVYGG